MLFGPCRDLERKLSAYLDGELPPRETQAVKAHLAACPSCSAALAAMRAAEADLKGLPSMEPSPFFTARAVAAAKAQRPEAGAYRRFLRLPVPALALMLGLMTAGLFSFVLNVRAMEPAQRSGLLAKVVAGMRAPDSLLNPLALDGLCGKCAAYLCECKKRCDMAPGKECPVCGMKDREGR
jgi:anti-sigma factor RsiW